MYKSFCDELNEFQLSKWSFATKQCQKAFLIKLLSSKVTFILTKSLSLQILARNSEYLEYYYNFCIFVIPSHDDYMATYAFE